VSLINCLIRALNSIYIQAYHLPITEYSHFVGYSVAVYTCLTTFLAKDGGWKDDGGKLRGWGNWLKNCEKGRNNFSADMCKGMEDFLPTLKTHFTKHKGGGKSLEGLDKTSLIPVFWTNHDGNGGNLPEDLDGGSKATRWWVGGKRAEWWKFSTCGFDGWPREVRFAGPRWTVEQRRI
jgi:hypothetical protein